MAAEKGHASAMFSLGQMYRSSPPELHLTDAHKAKYWFEKAIAAGSNSAVVQLGGLYIYNAELRDTQRGLELLHQAAAFSDDKENAGRAMERLGFIYLDCTIEHCNIAQDLEKSAYWFSRGAKMGNHVAQFFLANAYENGLGLPVDYAKAWYWYDQADPYFYNAKFGKQRLQKYANQYQP